MLLLFDLLGLAICLLIGYFLGSIPFAVLVSRAFGLADPRHTGSGNPGATNVLRSGNRWAAGLTLAGDLLKGWLAVALAAWAWQGGLLPASAVPLAGLGAVLGHLYPVFLRFHGGKGVATALGVLLGLQPWLALATVLSWLVIVLLLRYVSLASIAAAVFAPFYYILGGGVAWRLDHMVATVIVVISVLVLTRHRSNINRLLAGKENRLNFKKKGQDGSKPRRR